jgi:hypothetical protein
VLNEAEIFVEGEIKLGQYQVAIVRYTTTGWVPTVPPLNAYVTNYRLILHPQTRRPYPPASIPNTYITQVSDIELAQRPAVKICLKTGHRIYLHTTWSESDNLTETMMRMLTSPIGNSFELKPAQRDLNRLIRFISKL